MADGEHTHGTKHLTLDDVQSIIGRAMIDKGFREALTKDPELALKKMHISTEIGGVEDEKAKTLIYAIVEALNTDTGGVSFKDAMETLLESYLESTDGVIRPRCG